VQERSRRKTTLVYAAAILSQYSLDVLVLGFDVQLLAIRVLWSLGLVATALLRDEQSQTDVRLYTAFQSVLACFSFVALLSVTGGTASPYFEFLPCLPLILALVFPEDSLSVTIGGTLCTAGMVGLLVMEGAPPRQVLLGAGILVTLSLIGAYGASQFRKVQRAESEARLERARREALESLAISERRRAQSEKLATIGQLSASVMHEINNPVAFIHANLGYLEEQVLGPQPPAREELAEVFQETRAGVERVRQIIADLKGFSRMDAEEPTECTLGDVVNDAARIARIRLKHVARLVVEVPAELPPVRVVRRRLAQVLLNLLVNAGDALEERGYRDSEVRVTGSLRGSRVVLWVEDNGPGFPPEVLPRLFETFFTTKSPEKGTGLGLALSRELVEQFGGTLVAENREEGGARLRLELPCVNRGEA
jgi:signal transduction histidine kinase